jgi:predicted ArsR family transcriptional regulator
LLEAGREHDEVQATPGHTNIKTTSTYLKATAQCVKQALKKLEAKRRCQVSRSFVARGRPAADDRVREERDGKCVRV